MSIDLGKENVGVVSGFLDGFASLVTGGVMMAIGVLQAYSWSYSWVLLIGINILAFIPFTLIKIKHK